MDLAGEASEPVRARARIDLATLLATRGGDVAAAEEYQTYLSDHPEGADRADAWIGLAFLRANPVSANTSQGAAAIPMCPMRIACSLTVSLAG